MSWDRHALSSCRNRHAKALVPCNKGKPRVVVDLQKTKIKIHLYPDAYPLPRQADVLSATGGSTLFSSLDMTKLFFYQRTLEQDR